MKCTTAKASALDRFAALQIVRDIDRRNVKALAVDLGDEGQFRVHAVDSPEPRRSVADVDLGSWFGHSGLDDQLNETARDIACRRHEVDGPTLSVLV